MQSGLAQFTALILFVALCFGAAAAGAAWTGVSVDTWYAALQKPSWTPPNWLFGPVWTALYFCMAVAAWLVWRRYGLKNAWDSFAFFGGQLLLNTAWSGLFFGLQLPAAAFFDIILLWCAIAVTMTSFFRRSALAGWLFAPYLIWVSFAAALNFEIWRLNA